MPRDLKQTDRNEFIIMDAISACEIKLYYRQPTTAERIGFQRLAWQRQGKKVINRTPEARAQYGARILTGIREGDFSCGEDAAGHPILIASEPGALNYRPDWKELVISTAGDLLMVLGMQVFEGSFNELVKAFQANKDDQPEEPTEPDPEEEEPLEEPFQLPPDPDEAVEILPLAPNSNG